MFKQLNNFMDQNNKYKSQNKNIAILWIFTSFFVKK